MPETFALRPTDQQRHDLLLHHPQVGDWLDSLPQRAARLAERWSVTDLQVVSPGGLASWLLRGRRVDQQVALKLCVPGMDESVLALRWYPSGAVVQVLELAADEHAALLEWIDPGTTAVGVPDDEADDAAAATLARLWRPTADVAAGQGAEPLTQIATWQQGRMQTLSRELGWPELATLAGVLGELSTDPQHWLLFGDLHRPNLLRDARRGWVATDPNPITGAREYDLAVWLMHERSRPAERAAALALRLGLSGGLARRWLAVMVLQRAAWHAALGEHDAAAEYRQRGARVLASRDE